MDMAANYDLLIKGGWVIDPAQGIDGKRDVGLAGGTIAAVEKELPEGQAGVVYDATDRLVTPGLVDLHTHIYWGVVHSLDPDLVAYYSGSTTNVDVGTAGAHIFKGFRKHIVENSKSRVLSFLNIGVAGLAYSPNSSDVSIWDVGLAVDTIEANRDVIKGVKALPGPHFGQAYVHTIEGVELAKETATLAGVPLMVHLASPPPPVSQWLPLLEEGDILTHAFRGDLAKILGRDGNIRQDVWAAKERGVIFDMGHGSASFSFKVAKVALDQGLPPDIISTDLHGGCFQRRAMDMPTCMSRYLSIGLSLADVVEASTISPARAMGIGDEIGSLRVGSPGDVTVLELVEGEFELRDAEDNAVTASQKLELRLTVCGGEVLKVDRAYERSAESWLPRR
ncbi:MAG: amidohydrolase/deacetylase family metallohydrolase [Dehalococcoidia bacterium]|jgi:dihydroorotase|nr:amidohydrolase/deacetylase family metallohydrolase [Dehalococcoidia bacterium]